MRALINDLLRRAIGWCIVPAGLLLTGWQRLRILTFTLNQQRLRRRYKLSSDTPVLSYGAEVEHSIAAAAVKAGKAARFALTSGSAGDPKRLLYTNRRLRALKFVFSDMFARACWAFGIKRTSLYVFSSFETDHSLTSMLLTENDLPAFLSTLQAPYRVQRHRAVRALVEKYGSTAVRLWVVTIANPGVLYSTNPSTMSTFFDELRNDWPRSSKLIKDWCNGPAQFDTAIHKIARRLDSLGSEQRLQTIAMSDAPVAIEVWAPAVEAYICWTGGYVKPFVDKLQKYLPSPRYRLIPMYSMSTETVQTLSYFQDNDVSFIPAADGVVYEFLVPMQFEDLLPGTAGVSPAMSAKREKSASAGETPAVPGSNCITTEFLNGTQLLDPAELEPGKTYAMVISNGYGLRRYHTGDLFLCKRKVNGLPDLAFLKRGGLEYSFTGEKVTAEQVSIVFEHLRKQYPRVVADKYLTCVPAHSEDTSPHYNVLLVGERRKNLNLNFLANHCDELLCELNCEYKSKRANGLLGAVRFVSIGVREFAERFAAHDSWESQFKFLPFCPHLVWNGPERVS